LERFTVVHVFGAIFCRTEKGDEAIRYTVPLVT